MDTIAAQSTPTTFSECRKAFIKAHSPGWRNSEHSQQWTNTLNTYAEPVNQVDDDHVFAISDAIWLGKTETVSRADPET